jgi:hypothetical protein
MKVLISFLFFLTLAQAQPPRLELTPGGFEPVSIPFPATPTEKLIELTQNWAAEFNRREDGFDVTNVTANSITITANKDNAFYYRERGEAFDFKIRYAIEIIFTDSGYNLRFSVPEIYADDKRIDYTLPDYFTSDGRLKEGYDELERSLEATVNNIVTAHYNYILKLR